MDLLPIVKDVGFPVALCIVLIYAIKVQNSQLVRAFTDRIKTLEGVVESQGAEIQAHRKEIASLQREMLRRADEYATTLKDVANRYSKVVSEHDRWVREAFTVLSRLVDTMQMRPCMLDRYDPHPHQPLTTRTPSSSEIPPPPQTPTDPTKDETRPHHVHG